MSAQIQTQKAFVQSESQTIPTQAQKTTTTRKSSKPCFGFFGRDRKCANGDECRFSHDANVYKLERGLKDCPNGCGNFCQVNSHQCSKCLTAQRTEAERQKKARLDAMEDRKCQGFKCETMTKFRFCPECRAVNDAYLVNRE